MAIPRNLANLANQLNTDGEVPKIEVGDSKVEVTDTGSNGTIVFNTDNAERMRITSDGELLVNTTSRLEASGFTVGITGGETFLVSKGVYSVVVSASTRDIYMDNTGYFGYISSTRNSKTNIADITDVSWLYSLTPVSFNYRQFNRETNEYLDEAGPDLEYGLIAEDVEVVNSHLCFYDETEDGQKLSGISYKKLITPMLKAIQELKTELDAAKERIAALEA